MAEKGTDLEKAKAILSRGELVAIPTETVYGLAANALDASAVAKIFTVKNRPQFDPLIVHVPDLDAAQLYVEAIPHSAYQLASLFWPGPLTLILKKKPVIPDLVTAGLDTVGIRCPDHNLSRQLLQELPFPLAAPSANPFGYVSPTRPEHVAEQLGDKIQYILDGGHCSIGIESTIIGFESGTPVVYRLGGLSLEKIESVVGNIKIHAHSSSNPKAPGQLKSHYSPSKKMILGKIEELLQQYPAHCSGLLTFQSDFNSPHQFILSPSGDLEEAARNLFTALRHLDKLDIEVILAEPVPEHGLGRAINDRLRRAAADAMNK
jgi:L-threonylcarbamoyladenylate synthase